MADETADIIAAQAWWDTRPSGEGEAWKRLLGGSTVVDAWRTWQSIRREKVWDTCDKRLVTWGCDPDS